MKKSLLSLWLWGNALVAGAQVPAADSLLTQLLLQTRDTTGPRPIPAVLLQASIPARNWSWSGSAGVPPDATFPLASVTKTFTATVVLQLIEEGRLGYDAPLTGFFPPDFLDSLHQHGQQSWGRRITVRQLLRHTAGLADYILDNPALLAGVESGGGPTWTRAALWQSYFRQGLARKARFPPNDTLHAYSDTHYLLLGQLIERVTAEALADVFRRRLFGPLGMTSAYLAYDEAAPLPQPVANPYWGRRSLAGVNFSFDWGGGGLVMANADLHRYWRALWQGKLFRDPASRQRLTDWVRGPHPLAPDFRYGSGLVRARFEGLPELVGHAGFFKSFMVYFPEHDLYLTGTLGQAEADHLAFVRQVIHRLRQAGLVK